MKLQSVYLGELEVDDQQVMTFPKGIPAFENQTKFVFLPVDDQGTFFYMQSVTSPELCLITANPFVFFPDYQFDLGEQEQVLLEIKDQQDIVVLVILNVPEEFQKTTANLMAPLIINHRTRLGLQYVPGQTSYRTKHLIFPPAEKAAPQAAAAREGR
ncbi:flagellar assembly protein FliW [Syntrophomonas erecta]